MITKSALKRFLSIILLACFTAVALPLDLLHNHSVEELSCSDYGQTGHCSHKVHLSQKAPYCFACLIHYDKTFVKTEPAFFRFETQIRRIRFDEFLPKPFIQGPTFQSRGPPAVI